MIRVIKCVIVVFILAGCNEISSSTDGFDNDISTRATTRPNPPAGTPTLGFGYGVEDQAINYNNCVGGYVFEMGPVQETIQFSSEQSNESMRYRVNGSLDASVDIGTISLDAGGLLNNKNMENDLSYNYSFDYRFVAKRQVLSGFDPENPGVDSDFSVLCSGSGGSLPSEIVVGNEFVNTIELGGLLKFDLVIRSDNKEDLHKIGGHLKIGSSGIYLDVSGAQEAGVDLSNISIDLDLKQLGGKPERLADAVGGDVTVNCSAINWEDCAKIFELAIKYATTDFNTQFDSDNELKILSYNTIPYAHAGIMGIEINQGVNLYKQTAVLQYLRGLFDSKNNELLNLEAQGAPMSERRAVELDIESIEREYNRCKSSYLSCDSVNIL